VRNLVVAPGSWDGAVVGDRVVEVRRLRSLVIDPYTGDASLEIALALDRGVPITGGSIRIDLIAALARARRSTTTLTRGAYVGPALRVALDLVGDRRARADEAHVALEDVPELRQLVEARLAEPRTDARHARIAGDLEDRADHLVEVLELGLLRLGILDHRAEL